MNANFTKKRVYPGSQRSLVYAAVSIVWVGTALIAPRDALAQPSHSMPGMEMSSPSAPKPKAQPETRQAGEAKPPAQPLQEPAAARPATATSHESMEGMDHSQTHSMDMGSMQGGAAPPDARDADAYADGLISGPMPGMDMADDGLYGKLLLDKFEYADSDRALRLDGEAWYGGDNNKLWLKADGGRAHGRLSASRIELLWDRNVATYWSTQLGIRHDVGEGPTRDWAALGVHGLAPYWFEVQATAYVGQSGRPAARLEVDYELLFTQRLILQPNLEINLYGKDDPARGIGAGLSDIDFGMRLRYEIRRQFAPYLGIAWKRKFGKTADFARAADQEAQDTQLVVGLRMWF